MKNKKQIRRSGGNIMFQLILLLGNLACIMLLAVIGGSLGFLSAMGVTLFGAMGIAKVMGENIVLSYGMLTGLIIGCGVLRGLLRYLEQYGNHYIAFRLLAILRDKIFGALRRLCPAKLESKEKGAMIAMMTSDIETLEVFYAHTISPICIAVLVSLTVEIFVGVYCNWWMAGAALLGHITIGVFLPLWSSERLKVPGVRYRSEFSSFNAFYLDSLKGIGDLVLNNAGEKREKEVDRRSALLMEETGKMKGRITKNAALTELLVSFFILVSLVTGVILVTGNMVSFGRMLVGVVAVFGSFGPVIAISSLPGNLTQTLASGDRVLDLLSEEPAVNPIEEGEPFAFEDILVEHLGFSYDEKEEVLQDISMYGRKGEIIGIVGESGCGKSTFLKLLLRFWEKDEGVIQYNGKDIDEVPTEELHQQVTMVSQSTYLFDETIMENLRLAKWDATDEQIIEACKKASVHQVIAGLPEGYQTKAGALGDHLSAGEKQRIGLARAFLRGCGLILLDEPTSNVDSINEGVILESLKEQKKEHCIILVSHRESTMAIADRVYRVEKGRMYEQNRA